MIISIHGLHRSRNSRPQMPNIILWCAEHSAKKSVSISELHWSEALGGLRTKLLVKEPAVLSPVLPIGHVDKTEIPPKTTVERLIIVNMDTIDLQINHNHIGSTAVDI